MGAGSSIPISTLYLEWNKTKKREKIISNKQDSGIIVYSQISNRLASPRNNLTGNIISSDCLISVKLNPQQKSIYINANK